MTRFTQDEVSQIITGVIQGQGPKGIAQRIKRKQPSVSNVILALQKDKPLFQQILDGESVDMIAKRYVDGVSEGFSERGVAMAKIKLAKNPSSASQLSRIEAKLDELLAHYKDKDVAMASTTTYDAQGKRRSFFG